MEQTSGDFTADRRFAYAQACADDGDFAAAADLVRQTLEIAPLWAAGWFRLGEHYERLEQVSDAIVAYQKCLDISPIDRLGAGLKLALLGQNVFNTPPIAYAEALFDEYADRFEQSLVVKLGYCIPEILAGMLDKNVPATHFETAVDLGCGTGLMAVQVRKKCTSILGVDLSENMLAKAEEKGIYDRLEKANLLDALAHENNVSLIMAADVFIYLPTLDEVFSGVAKSLTKGGSFLFSVEKANDPDGCALLPSRRYAHGENYVKSQLSVNGFQIVAMQDAIIRMDAGAPLTGLLVLAKLRGAAKPKGSTE